MFGIKSYRGTHVLIFYSAHLFLLLDSKVVFHVYKITIINLILGFSATPSSPVV